MRKKTITICIALVVFAVMTGLVASGRTAGFDDTIRFAFYSIRCAGLTAAAKVFAAIGSWWGISILCAALLAIKATRLKAGVPVALAAVSSQVTEKIIKAIIQRPRPPYADRLVEIGGWSFPSGHSTTSMAVFLMLIYIVRTQVRSPFAKNLLTVILAIPMICVGLSRIYLGVHYPSDVIGGWSLGVAMAMSCIIFGEKIEAGKAGKPGREPQNFNKN